jgi:hypothetical protein
MRPAAPQLPAILASPSAGIVNAKLVKAHGGTDAANASRKDTAERWLNSSASVGAGSGPYTLGSYSATFQIALRANTSYWGPKKPPFRAVVIRNLSAPAQLINIRRGSHQIAIDLSSGQALALKGNRNRRVSRQPSPWVFYAFTNDDGRISSATSNKRFQQAVRHALGYKAIRSVAGPGAIRAPGIIPAMILGALPQKDAVKYDRAKARAELAASGVGTGQVTLEYPTDLTINGVPFSACGLPRLHAGRARRAPRRLAEGERSGNREARREGACRDGVRLAEVALPADPAGAQCARPLHSAHPADAGLRGDVRPCRCVVQRRLRRRRHADFPEVAHSSRAW